MLSQHPPELIAIASSVLTGQLSARLHALGVACSRGRQTKLFDFELPATRCCWEVDKFVWGARRGHTNNSPLNTAKRVVGGRQRQLGPPRCCMGLGGRGKWTEMLSGGVQAMAATYTDPTRLQMARDATGSQAPGQRAVYIRGPAVLSRCRGWEDGIAVDAAGSVCCTEPQASGVWSLWCVVGGPVHGGNFKPDLGVW